MWVSRQALVGVHHHGPELDDRECFAAPAKPRLPVEHRPPIVQPDGQRNPDPEQQKQRQQDEVGADDEREIQGALVQRFVRFLKDLRLTNNGHLLSKASRHAVPPEV